MSDALRVRIMRGETLESEHRADAVVRHADGRFEAGFGDPARLCFPRSAIKPLQALPLVECGAADAYHLDHARLALACASHDHEPAHVATVRAWLADIGCSAHDLACGIQPPDDPVTIAELAMRGEHADAAYNNCSGKHTGMLTTARHLDEPLAGYIEYRHPVQTRIRGLLAAMSGCDTETAPWERDGCSIPTLALPLDAWALAMARMTGVSGVDDRHAEAAARIARAIADEPFMIGGERSWDSCLIKASEGRVIVKRGAEGVACGWLPGTDTGFALKVADGASRAVPVAVGALAARFGWLDVVPRDALAPLFEPRRSNWNGYTVGRLEGTG